MERLVSSQRELQGRISRTVENFKKAGATKMTAALARSALRLLEKKWDKFESQHTILLREYSEELAEHDYVTADLVSEVEMDYLQQRAQLMEFEEEHTPPPAAATPAPRSDQPTANVLPRIQLPQFSGRFEDWPSFRDLFRAIVIDEASLPKVKKCIT
ncbi:hypothetical protein RF55_12814 [Lasius niger]|uniref:Uncharacterized protein n=1 Tax=Lasius niger TaxID=67767 RepID=A0A0J7KC40_LASNI|nr:hypothetical protein RF55_12814 [Lasius niger]